jgi:hypothetical protein
VTVLRELATLLPPLAIAGLSLAAGALAGAHAWFATGQAISRAEDGDDINLTLNLLAGESVFAGLVAGLLATLIAASVLSWAWRSVRRKFSPR